jgi:hypothetical protein
VSRRTTTPIAWPARALAAGRLAALALLLALPLPSGCFAHTHRIGGGANDLGEESVRQWYLFFGLKTLNEVDTQRFLGGVPSYEIVTAWGFWDAVLAPLLAPLTITTRTVTVRW